MMRIIFFGTPEFITPVLQALQQNYDVAGVVTASEASKARLPAPERSDGGQGQALQGCPIFTPEKLDDTVVLELKNLNPDLFVVAAYGKIIPQNILDIPKFGALNIHPSCLPKYRGPSPIQSAILNGDQTACVNIIQMDAKMDHGPIVASKEIRLSNQDTFETLSKKMFTEGAELLIKVIPDYAQGIAKLQTQNDNDATFTKIITKEEGYFDINNPPSAETLDRMTRAYHPWPNVWTKWSFDKAQDKNDRIVKFYPGGLVQMEGKKPTKLEDFLRGYPNFPIKHL